MPAGSIPDWLACVFSPAVVVAADSANAGARKSPDWLKKAVVYEIFPRGFSQAGDFKKWSGYNLSALTLGSIVMLREWIPPTG
jgi:hypothetical protein